MIAWLRHHRTSFAQTLSRLAQAPAATLLNVLAAEVARCGSGSATYTCVAGALGVGTGVGLG